MSIFAGLKKCENSFCQKYVHEKDCGKYIYNDLKLCSQECIHSAELFTYMNKNKDKLDITLFFEQVREHFEKFREEIMKNYVIIFILYRKDKSKICK